MRKPSPFGGRWPRPRPRPDEGRVCRNYPLTGWNDSALISRLRAAASPEGEALETQKEDAFAPSFFTYTHIFGVPAQ